jgi:O-antigen/teichoic acid export membrane protein
MTEEWPTAVSIPAEATPTLTRRELQDRAVRGSLWTLINVALTLPLGIVANALTARVLGPAEYGQLAFLLAAFTIALPLTELGFGQALAQWGAASEMQGDRATTELLLRSRMGFVVMVQLPLLSAVGMLVLIGEPSWVRGVLLAVTVVLLVGGGAQAVLLLQNRTAAMAKIALAVGIAVQAGVVGAALITGNAASVWAARLVLGAFAPVIAAGLISRRLLRLVLRPRLPRGLPPGFWRFALLAWVAGASALLVYSRSEVFVLRVLGQSAELGFFAVAFGLSQQLTLPLDSLLAPLFPANAALSAGHPEHVREAFFRSLRFFALLAGGLLALAPAVCFLTPIAFGRDFSRSATLFVPLALASTLQSVSSPFTVLVFARRRGSVLAVAFVAGLAVDIGLAVWLIPSHGAWGAVIANIAGQVTAIAVLTRSEIAAQGATVREIARAARPWGLAVVSLVPGFLLGQAGRATLPAAAVPLAAAAGLGSFTLLLKLAGPSLTGPDADALTGLLPARLQRLTRLLLAPALSQRRRRAARP